MANPSKYHLPLAELSSHREEGVAAVEEGGEEEVGIVQAVPGLK